MPEGMWPTEDNAMRSACSPGRRLAYFPGRPLDRAAAWKFVPARPRITTEQPETNSAEPGGLAEVSQP